LPDDGFDLPLPFGEVAHLGWVVRDIEKTLAYWESIGLGKVHIDPEHKIENAVFRGKQADVSVRWGWAQLGRVGIEIFQPWKGYSAYDEFLERHGEGIQHVAFAQTSPQQLESRVAALEQLGVGVQMRGTFRNEAGTFVYMDTEPVGGVTLELVYDPNYLKNLNKPAPAAPEGQLYPFGDIVQYAICTFDVDRVCDFYHRLGFEDGGINRDNKGLLRRYRGVELDLRMHMGWSKFGDTQLEILQPTRAYGVYDEFLERHGEGFHHIAFAVDDMDTALAAMRDRGVEVSQDGAWGRNEVAGRFAYLDTDAHGGLSIELLWSK
jgi:catechol 2,3-dioxygenase-like lactoylglutathione lyase family enzyme